jgi:structure-specific endonuclease subunit SLX1
MSSKQTGSISSSEEKETVISESNEKPISETIEKPWFVYLLATTLAPSRTYVGATIDPDRRLRQHNGQLKGGARATSRVPGGWYRVCYIKGFESKREALRFEWWWKRRSAKLIGTPLERRQAAMEAMLGEWPSLELEVN